MTHKENMLFWLRDYRNQEFLHCKLILFPRNLQDYEISNLFLQNVIILRNHT